MIINNQARKFLPYIMAIPMRINVIPLIKSSFFILLFYEWSRGKNGILIVCVGGSVVKVEIPDSLYKRIEAIAKFANYENVNEYIVYILREAVSKIEEEILESDISEEEKKEIIERLKSLGYL